MNYFAGIFLKSFVGKLALAAVVTGIVAIGYGAAYFIKVSLPEKRYKKEVKVEAKDYKSCIRRANLDLDKVSICKEKFKNKQ